MAGKFTPEQRRAYDRDRYQKRMARLHALLGGKCVSCGSNESLEIDHIDRSKKRFTIGKGWTKPWSTLIEEVQGCQLLCKKCHYDKSVANADVAAPAICGLSASKYKRGCKCDACREARNRYHNEYRKRKRLEARQAGTR